MSVDRRSPRGVHHGVVDGEQEWATRQRCERQCPCEEILGAKVGKGRSSLASAMGQSSPTRLLAAAGAELARTRARSFVLGVRTTGHVHARGPRRRGEAGGVTARPQYAYLVGRAQLQHPAAAQGYDAVQKTIAADELVEQ
jgi:hypothetical protein